MALDTYAALQTAVLGWLARPGDPLVAPAVPDMITLFEAEANRRLRVIDAEKTAFLSVAADGSVALPADCFAVRQVWLNDVPIQYMPPGNAPFSNTGGNSLYYTLLGQNVGGVWYGFNLFFGPAASSGTVQVTYQVGVPPLSDLAPTNWLLMQHRDAYLFGTLAEAELYIGHDERAPMWLARRDASFQSIENMDRKTRWGGPMQIRADGIQIGAGTSSGGGAAPAPVPLPGGAGFVTVSDTPPANPSVGDAWWDGVGAQLYIWVNDGTSAAWVPATNTSGTAISSLRTEAPVSGAVIVMTAADQSLAITSGTLAALTIFLPPGPAAGQEVELWFAAPVTTLAVVDAAGAAITGAPDSAYGPGAAIVMRWTGTVWVLWK